MIFCSIKSWAGRELNPYITKILKIHKSLTNSLIIKTIPFLKSKFSEFLKYTIL